MRFGITLDAIVAANEITDINNISVGDSLVLPGLDWASGTINTLPMPLGETYRSMSRRYRLDTPIFTRLSGVVSPGQLAAGYPILMAVDGIEDLRAGRVAVGSQDSLFELAIRSNANPWEMAAVNQLEGPSAVIPGDVLFVPGTDDPGPGAFPSPVSQFEFDGDSLIQGKTAVFRISAGGLPMTLGGELMGNQLNFFDIGSGNYVALQGVYVLADVGYYPLEISGTMPDGAEFNYAQLVTVADGGYSFETLTVEDSYLDDEVSGTELEFVNGIVSQVTPERLWDTFFVAPSPYSDTINSYFGTRRSFNGSPFDYYHSGVDFGGGLGVEIFAPAPGVVVFAGPLEIRGNATIIDHGWGVFTGYWHQSEIRVNVGDHVELGQVIGIVGNTGRSTGAHLHWEVWVGGIQVDGLDWLYNSFP
jgi:murein DD-endopeptidase MepM/ murein hydrolase activator NlpD